MRRRLRLSVLLVAACSGHAPAAPPPSNEQPRSPGLAGVRLIVTHDDRPYVVLEEEPGLPVAGDDDDLEKGSQLALALHPAGAVSAERAAWVGRSVSVVSVNEDGTTAACTATLGPLALMRVASTFDDTDDVAMDGMLVAPLEGGCTGDWAVVDGPPFRLEPRHDAAIEASARQRFEALPAFAQVQASAGRQFALDGPWQDEEVVTIVGDASGQPRWVRVDARGGDGGWCFRNQELHATWQLDGDTWRLLEPPVLRDDARWIGDLDGDGTLERLSAFAIETWTGSGWRALHEIAHDSLDDMSDHADCD